MNNTQNTGHTIVSAKFDTTGLENPFYETSSKGDSLIEQMKNNNLLIEETQIEFTISEQEVGKKKENDTSNPARC